MKQQIQQKLSRNKATYLFLNVQEWFYGKDLKLNLEEGVGIWEVEKREKNIQSENNRTDISETEKLQNTFVRYCLFHLHHPEYTYEFRILGREITRVKSQERMILIGYFKLDCNRLWKIRKSRYECGGAKNIQ